MTGLERMLNVVLALRKKGFSVSVLMGLEVDYVVVIVKSLEKARHYDYALETGSLTSSYYHDYATSKCYTWKPNRKSFMFDYITFEEPKIETA